VFSIGNGVAFGPGPFIANIGETDDLLNRLSEKLAAMVVALKHIEAGTGRRQQNKIFCLGALRRF